MTNTEVEAAKAILEQHTVRDFCCYADRGPCYWDGVERKFKCDAKTCKVCARSPYDAAAPSWPCPSVILARKILDDSGVSYA